MLRFSYNDAVSGAAEGQSLQPSNGRKKEYFTYKKKDFCPEQISKNYPD